MQCVILPGSYHLHDGNAAPSCSGDTGALDMAANKVLTSLDYKQHSLTLSMC